MNKFAIMIHFTTHCLSLSFLCCSSRGRATWSASAMDGRRKYGGYGACFKRFVVGIPIESWYRTPSVTKQSALKCLEHSIECFDGPSQLLRCRFTALTHFACKSCSRGNPCKLYPSPLFVLHPAATQCLGIVVYVATVYRELKLAKTRHAYVSMYDACMQKTYLTFGDTTSGETRNLI